MASKDTTLTRRSSRKKLLSSKSARSQPRSTSLPRLGAYGRKHPAVKLTPAHKKILRSQTPKKPSSEVTASNKITRLSASNHEFLLFCIKHVLESGNLVTRDGTYWRLRKDVVGVSFGENFTSLDSCAEAIISSLQMQYRGSIHAAA